MIKKTPAPSQWSHHGPPIEKQPTNIIFFFIFLHGHWTMIYYGFPTKFQWMIIQKY